MSRGVTAAGGLQDLPGKSRAGLGVTFPGTPASLRAGQKSWDPILALLPDSWSPWWCHGTFLSLDFLQPGN